MNSDSACVQFEDFFYNRCGFGVGNPILWIVGTAHISIRNRCADSFPALSSCMKNGSYLLACVSGVEIIEIILDA